MSAAPDFTLYGYFRSSAAFRVRIALNLKGIAPQLAFIHLRKGGGEQHAPDYHRLNPQELIPLLIHGETSIAQSLAIIEYLEEVVPEPPLLPKAPAGRARVRQLALAVVCDIHPLNNLRVQQYLTQHFGADEAARLAWQTHWMALGFAALEEMLAQDPARGRFCHGDAPGLADICLIPQLANARRGGIDLSPYPILLAIEEEAFRLAAFGDARPQNQPDAE
jgi:maleylacetoacetate isomerase